MFAVYLTMYLGDKLPKWYIGSSNVKKILNGYNGTVSSKKWKSIYNLEQKENKHLFKTRILSMHKTRNAALIEENRVQRLHDIVQNDKYFNESYANKHGCFGRDVSGKNNPMYGKTHSDDVKKKQSILQKQRIGEKNSNYGNYWDDIKKEKLSKLKKSKEWQDNIGISSFIKQRITKTKTSKWYLVKNDKHEIIIDIISQKDLHSTDRCLLNSTKEKPVGGTKASLRELKKRNKMHLTGCYVEQINPSLAEIKKYFEEKYYA